jgi:hypothetical protein
MLHAYVITTGPHVQGQTVSCRAKVLQKQLLLLPVVVHVQVQHVRVHPSIVHYYALIRGCQHIKLSCAPLVLKDWPLAHADFHCAVSALLPACSQCMWLS